MGRSKKPAWTPATEFTVVKLKPNGPKPGQTVSQFLYGKDKGYQELVDNPRVKFKDLP